ncbi:MAG TPA: hypothetical protein VD788_10665 [Candidatus Polarisedimenticolaceae bacterium]|nr:hypothetical protein [Candidatus Polarisedimenticolaceae bacterium]
MSASFMRLASRLGRPAAVVCTVLLGVACGGGDPRGAASVDLAAADYVGIEACSGCHLGVYTSYAGTGMARSVRMAEIDPRPAGPARLVVGSGNHARAIFHQDAGDATRPASCSLAPGHEWHECPDDPRTPSHLAGAPLEHCLGCHAAVAREGVAADGVDCERCHGPGSIHVDRWRSATGSDGEADPTIVNPRRLPHAERMAVCLRCHFGAPPGLPHEDRAAAAARVTEFRPGPFLEGFATDAQGARLMSSRCYVESGGGVDCLTCHDPHVTVYHDDRPPERFRRACLRCHAADDCTLEPGTRAATRPPDDCTACHMRRAEPEDQAGTHYTDHWIRRPIDRSR